MLLTAFISSLGIPFFWQALHEQFNDRVANLASWILALYPENIILGGSQMREPLIIGLCGIVLWGLVHYKKDKRTSLISLFTSMLVLTLVSTRYAVAVLFLILLWIWADTSSTANTTRQKLWKTIPLLVVILAGLAISSNWLVNTARWDLYLMESSSGRVQFELENIGGVSASVSGHLRYAATGFAGGYCLPGHCYHARHRHPALDWMVCRRSGIASSTILHFQRKRR
jgi:hypothetical protein